MAASHFPTQEPRESPSEPAARQERLGRETPSAIRCSGSVPDLLRRSPRECIRRTAKGRRGHYWWSAADAAWPNGSVLSEELHRAVGPDLGVRRLEVAVDHASAVRGFEPFSDLDRDLDGAGRRQDTARDDRPASSRRPTP